MKIESSDDYQQYIDSLYERLIDRDIAHQIDVQREQQEKQRSMKEKDKDNGNNITRV